MTRKRKQRRQQLGLFIKDCIVTGARPYCELARVTADHVVQALQGMDYLLEARAADGRHVQ